MHTLQYTQTLRAGARAHTHTQNKQNKFYQHIYIYVHTWDIGFKDIMLLPYISQIFFLTFSWLWEISGMSIAPQNNKL